ncbi:MAG: hypothetical protein N2246_08515, partial [Candidatus Sumerlaeia bacterium]|nr:hypothetical protein [Candidatus Sumerlaeia bacterium]
MNHNTETNIITFSLLVLLCVFSLPLISGARVIYVPADYPTIQQAIDAAVNGDEIIVSPGTYYENINFGGKDIILRSIDPTNSTVVASTTIHGKQTGSVVTFSGAESPACILSGFTLKFGKTNYGAGINGNATQATIQYNIIRFNQALNSGGGIYKGNGIIQNNIISDNSASSNGGGLCECNGTIKDNTISGNSAAYG